MVLFLHMKNEVNHEQACLWMSFALPCVLKLSLFCWSVLVIIGICLFWILHLLLHLIRMLPEEDRARVCFSRESWLMRTVWCVKEPGSSVGRRV
jgi:hypothetical protein